MSAETVNMTLGIGELFIKRENDASGKYIHVGCLKDNVTFGYTMETVEAKPGNKLTAIRRDKVAEKAMLKASVCEFKMSQLIPALGLSTSLTQLTNTSTLRAYQEITFGSSTTSKTLARTAVSATSIVVYTIDRATKYAKGTQFTATTGKLRPLSASIARKTVFVAFDFARTTTASLRIGDKVTLQTVDLKFTHRLSDGKYITIEIPRATITGGLSIPFGERDYVKYDITFEALGNPTSPDGDSLFRIIREA